MSDTALTLPDLLARTPARVLTGRAGPGCRTATSLQLREDHAAARDAVQAEVNLLRDFGDRDLFEARTRVQSKAEYLKRPDLGRRLAPDSAEAIRAACPAGCDLQVAVGDGLSATAVAVQAPGLLDRLRAIAAERGWSVGRPIFVRSCRVGVMNDLGDLLSPSAIVLLIGERPGLATAESLSAYLAWKPRTRQTDADRNLISNIHARGVSLDEAAAKITSLVSRMRELGRSGVGVTESIIPPGSGTRIEQTA